MVYWIYNFFLTLFLIAGLPLFPLFVLFGGMSWQELMERIGFYPEDLIKSLHGCRPVWIHAVSVGEVRSAACLISQIKERFPGRKILFSTFTRTGNRIARQTGAGMDGVIFFPLDHPWIVRRALRLFNPSLLIFLETEIWPSFLQAAYSNGIPTLLMSGRISPQAFRRYCLFRRFFSTAVRQFTALGMQNEDYAGRIISLGVEPTKVSIVGNLKLAAWEGRGVDEGNGKMDLDFPGKEGRRFLVAGSTHRGEEEILLDIFLFLKSRFPDLLLVLAPRHPQRFAEVERLLQKRNVSFVRRSQMNGQRNALPDVIFLDTLGELPAVYGLADVAFVGGSLVNAGGHNLMEPARWCKPILFGPYMTTFAEIAEEMKKRGGAIEVKGREDLKREISGLLTDRSKGLKMGELAAQAVEEDRGVVERSMALIDRFIDR
ncbi:MAG: 3-deoxy-D-manno-octulosonic acid transferase, partial [Candidatus Binatia bacterium]